MVFLTGLIWDAYRLKWSHRFGNLLCGFIWRGLSAFFRLGMRYKFIWNRILLGMNLGGLSISDTMVTPNTTRNKPNTRQSTHTDPIYPSIFHSKNDHQNCLLISFNIINESLSRLSANAYCCPKHLFIHENFVVRRKKRNWKRDLKRAERPAKGQLQT